MTVPLNFGTAQRLRLEPQPHVAIWTAPSGMNAELAGRATAAALASPLDFPPLAQAIVPGDKVAIALAAGVPQAPAILAATIEYLSAAGITPSQITIVLPAHAPFAVDKGDLRFDFNPAPSPAEEASSDGPTADDIRELTPERRPPSTAVRVIHHDPSSPASLEFLAADDQGAPLYLNRTLLDADFVIPIGVARPAARRDQARFESCLYPAFADAQAQARWGAAREDVPPPSRKKNRQRSPAKTHPRAPAAAAVQTEPCDWSVQAEHMAWLLGAAFAIEVVPAGNGEALAILAGAAESVRRQSVETYRQAWPTHVPAKAELVVAALDGGPDQQTWDNVARAWAAAERLAATEGAIVICSELTTPAGEALQRQALAGDHAVATDSLPETNSVDWAAAEQLSRFPRQTKLFLLSRLNRESVEDLGLAPVDSAEEVARLILRSRSCIILAAAQYALPSIASENP